MTKIARIINLLSIAKKPLSSWEIQSITNCWFIRSTLIKLERNNVIKYNAENDYTPRGYVLK